MTGGEILFLKPNTNWTQSNARFAAYFFGTGNTWASMENVKEDTGNTVYKVTVPSGSWTNVIFCRMNPSATANNWDNKWNQTGDLTYDGTKNCFLKSTSGWDSHSNDKWETTPYCIPGATLSWSNNYNTEMEIGDEQTITATLTANTGTITYSSSDEKVLTVNSNGKVKAIGEGTATINASHVIANAYCCRPLRRDSPEL